MTDVTEPIRRRELAEAHARGELVERNEVFTQYVTGTAFQLTLSQNQIRGFASIDTSIAHDHEWLRAPVSESVMAALIRRGLLQQLVSNRELHAFRGDAGPWRFSQVLKVTRAGHLMLELLAEAGLIPPRALRHPLPPPPPGWLDPRPKARWDHEAPGGPALVFAPSERETHGGGS